MGETEKYISEIFQHEKPEGPKPEAVIPLLGKPSEELTIFQHDLLHQFCITFNHLLPVFPQSVVGDTRAEILFDLIGLHNYYYFSL